MNQKLCTYCDDLLEMWVHPRFLSFSRQGELWQITFDDSPNSEMGTISSENVGNLLAVWSQHCEQWAARAQDAEYQRGYKAGYDRAAAEIRNCLVECDSELSAQAHGRPASTREELLRLSGLCRDLTKPKISAYHR